MLLVTRRDDRRSRSCSTSSCRRACSRSRTPACSPASPRRRRTSRSPAMQRAPGAGQRDRAGRPRRRARGLVRRRRRSGAGNTGTMFVALQAARRAQDAPPTRSSRACARSSRSVPGIDAVPAVGAGRARRRPRARARSTSTRCRTRDLDELRDLGAAGARARCASCPSCRTSTPTSRPPASSSTSTIDRDTAARLGITAADDRRHALRRLRPAPGRDVVHAAQPVPRRARGDARRSRPAPSSSRTSTCASPAARMVPLSTHRARSASAPTPLSINHQGQFPATTLSFNLAPGVALGAGRRRRSTRAERADRHARQRPRQLSRAPRRPSARRSRASRC